MRTKQTTPSYNRTTGWLLLYYVYKTKKASDCSEAFFILNTLSEAAIS